MYESKQEKDNVKDGASHSYSWAATAALSDSSAIAMGSSLSKVNLVEIIIEQLSLSSSKTLVNQ